jgi:signal transduction histidine kinase
MSQPNPKVEIRTQLKPAPVMGDPVLLERLTQNLIDNAIRYNVAKRGEVSVTTDTMGDNAGLTVENTGPLVPAYEIPGLFEPFRRLPGTERIADVGTSSIGRGAGLGLSIVRSVARAHGGDVYATPREDGGLIVRIRLPAPPAEPIPKRT